MEESVVCIWVRPVALFRVKMEHCIKVAIKGTITQ